MEALVGFLIGLFGRLPLSVLHGLGNAFGRLAFALSLSTRQRVRQHLAYAASNGIEANPWQAASESGKAAFELAWLWTHTPPEVLAHASVSDADRACVMKDVPTVFLTPHLGSFEVCGQYISHHLGITALYSPPKFKALDGPMRRGRELCGVELAPANLQGVKQLLRALKRGRSVGILPDQVPSGGDGVWVDFFGQPAYTMTLVTRLAQSMKARLVMCVAVRRRQGAGFDLHFNEVPPLPDDPLAAATALNQAVETAITLAPEQYLWSYKRYKHPAGAPLPPSASVPLPPLASLPLPPSASVPTPPSANSASASP